MSLQQGSIVLPKFNSTFEDILKSLTGKDTSLMWKAGRPYVIVSFSAKKGTVLLVPQRTLYTAYVKDRLWYEDDRHYLREIVWWQVMSADVSDLYDTGNVIPEDKKDEALKRIQSRLFGEGYDEPDDGDIGEFYFRDGTKSGEVKKPQDVIPVPNHTVTISKPESKPEPKPEAKPEPKPEDKPATKEDVIPVTDIAPTISSKRPHKYDRTPIIADVKAGMLKRDVMKKHGICANTLYRICKEYGIMPADAKNSPTPMAENFVKGSVVNYTIPNLKKVPDGVRKSVKNAAIVVQDAIHMNKDALLDKYKSASNFDRQIKRAQDLLNRYHITVE